ncbi:MAG: metal ABC transporter permease [Bauldia sp.]|nr:metal ABC transporter permease [Bauldia sp.]
MDEFFVRALLGGIGVALVAGPLGCFVLWRRLAYFGDTLSHAALLGVTLALLLEIHIVLGVFVAAALVAIPLVLLGRRPILASDTILGILSHSTLAIGIIVVALMATVQVDLIGYLFGDILAVSWTDIAVIWGGGALVVAVLAVIWRPLFAGTVNAELAAAEGLRPEIARIVFTMLMAAVVAIALKIVGAMLITALLIIPAAAARRFARGPEAMAFLAAAFGVAAVVLGLHGSLWFDTPSGPSIVVGALALFVVSLLPFRGRAAEGRS